MANDPRAICADCGHVWSWHDRDAARSMRSGELASDRRCYREVGGAGCRCSGFRDSGELAIVAARQPAAPSVAIRALLTLLLVVMGLGLLYAYRAQTPAISTIPMTQAIQEINGGQVKKITIVTGANKATLELANGTDKQQTNLPDKDEIFQKAIADYNTANPSKQILLDYQQESATFSVIGSVVLSLLPVLLLGGFFLYLFRRSVPR